MHSSVLQVHGIRIAFKRTSLVCVGGGSRFSGCTTEFSFRVRATQCLQYRFMDFESNRVLSSSSPAIITESAPLASPAPLSHAHDSMRKLSKHYITVDCSLTSINRWQVKQLLYGPTRRQRLGADVDVSAAALEQEQESALLSELAEGDFSADQNVVEVCDIAGLLCPIDCPTGPMHLSRGNSRRYLLPSLQTSFRVCPVVCTGVTMTVRAK